MSDEFDIYVSGTRDALVERIATLRESDRPAWGKLSCIGMLVHCQKPLLVAVGDLRLPRTWLGRLFGRIAKRSLTSSKPTPRNLPTDPHFLAAPSGSFDAERATLVALVDRFVRAGPAGAPKEPHPFFGPLEPHEWSRLMAKHLDHHLRQFGR